MALVGSNRHKLAALLAVFGLIGPASSGLLCLTMPASPGEEHGCCPVEGGFRASPVLCCDRDATSPSSPAAPASAAPALHTMAAGKTPPAPPSVAALVAVSTTAVPTVLRI